MMESLREKSGRRVVLGICGLLLSTSMAAGCAIESDAATREIGACGSTAAFGDGYEAGTGVDNVSDVVASVKEDLEYLEGFIADSGNDTFRLDNPEGSSDDPLLDYVELRVHEDEIILATESENNDGDADLLKFERREDGSIGPVSYGTVVCTDGPTVIPTRAVEFIKDLASVAHSIDGEPS